MDCCPMIVCVLCIYCDFKYKRASLHNYAARPETNPGGHARTDRCGLHTRNMHAASAAAAAPTAARPGRTWVRITRGTERAGKQQRGQENTGESTEAGQRVAQDEQREHGRGGGQQSTDTEGHRTGGQTQLSPRYGYVLEGLVYRRPHPRPANQKICGAHHQNDSADEKILPCSRIYQKMARRRAGRRGLGVWVHPATRGGHHR